MIQRKHVGLHRRELTALRGRLRRTGDAGRREEEERKCAEDERKRADEAGKREEEERKCAEDERKCADEAGKREDEERKRADAATKHATEETHRRIEMEEELLELRARINGQWTMEMTMAAHLCIFVNSIYGAMLANNSEMQ